MSTAAIDIDRLVVRYGKVTAVREFSYRCPPGRITALLGPNGAGKSSVLAAVSTAITPAAGRVRIFGHETATEAAAARSKLGLVFQERTLDKDLSVYRNLWFHARLFGMAAADARRRIGEILARFGLADRRDDDVSQLSGGLARRVELARALLHQPSLLILDEPTTGLDPTSREQVWQDLRRMRRELGVSILFSTHYLDEADNADEIVVIDGGRLVAAGSAAQLKHRVAGSCIRLRTEDDTTALANLVEAGLDAAFDDGMLVVPCAEPEKAMAGVLAVAGVGVREVAASHPTLNDVYLALTAAGAER